MAQLTPPPGPAPTLEVRDLTFTYAGQPQPILTNINLTLTPGEIVLVAGATGSGKSTLLSCLAGIAPNYIEGKLSGQICYGDLDLATWSVRRRSQYLGMLLQNVETQIFTDTVWEELAFGLENWAIPATQIEQTVEGCLQEFGLTAQRHWQIRQLSAGQKQRLLLGGLLAIGQPVLLLDEPLAYLDADGVEHLLRLLQRRASQGQAVLLVEHQLDRVRPICDRTYYVHQGQLLPGSPPNSAPPSLPLSQGTAVQGEIRLQTHNLSWGGYPPFPDLQVRGGETVLLQGDNGCGKTTLLQLLCGLLRPQTGAVEILGRAVGDRPVYHVAKQVGFVLQNPNHQLFADSVQAEVQQPGIDPAIAQQILTQLNLTDQAERHPQSLSQGQKHRLALGAVLARQPAICLLDEITVGQDPHSLALMLQVLQDFTRQGNTLILTSHDPHIAAALQARLVPLGSHVHVT